MYNLLVSVDDKAWERDEYVCHVTRFLEYTDMALCARLKALNAEAIAELTSLPTLFVYEKPVDKPARVGWLTSILTRQDEIKVAFRFDPRLAPIAPGKIEALLWQLQIKDSELNRTHWSVKEVDLLDVLNKATVTIATANAARGEYKFARQTLLEACDILKVLAHRDLDRFFLALVARPLGSGKSGPLGRLLARTSSQPIPYRRSLSCGFDPPANCPAPLRAIA